MKGLVEELVSTGNGDLGAGKVPAFYTLSQVADILSVSKQNIASRLRKGALAAEKEDLAGDPLFHRSQLEQYDSARAMFSSKWDEEMGTQPSRPYKMVELFAGAGGLAIGMEMAGMESVLLNELDKHACATLRANRGEWNVVEGDVSKIGFKEFDGEVDVLTGGFPCQAFSYAGQKMGFKDARGTLFFEYARAVTECNPRVILAENVRGLLSHEDGKTFRAIQSVIDEIGYELVEPQVLKALFYKVPQKRERLFFVAVRKDLASLAKFVWPSPYYRILTMRDALFNGDLYPVDVPGSVGISYTPRKAEIMSHVPPGGYWRDLPDELQREYMMKSYFLGGGKTGMARRLSWDEPSLTLTCSPAQKQTERCHPEESRPLTVREYARVQTFPDEWEFKGPPYAQYKQIGNAVPVNLAHAVGRSVVRLLNGIETHIVSGVSP